MTVHPRVSIKQVAAEAGVSIQTVSRVINDVPTVLPETRARVQEVIERLGYRPSAVARSLTSRRTYTLGVVGSGIEYYGPSHVLIGIEREAAALGFSILLSILHDPEREPGEPVLEDMLSRQVEGIIWAVPEIGTNRDWIDGIEHMEVPMVFLTMEPRPGIPGVSLDNHTGARLAVEHMVSQGRRNIAHIAGPGTWWEARQRRLGWEETLSAAGLPCESRQVVEGDWTAKGGEDAFHRLVEQYPEMDAVFAANDQMAQGVLHAAWGASIPVPGALAVVGFDDIPEAAYFIPPLTTVKQETLDLGSAAVRLLHSHIKGEQSGDRNGNSESVEQRWLQPKLVVRASSVAQPGVTATQALLLTDS